MVDIVMFPTAILQYNDTQIRIEGSACVNAEGAEVFGWDATVNIDALATSYNTAIRDGAIYQAGLLGYTVGLLDKKTIVGGAIGL